MDADDHASSFSPGARRFGYALLIAFGLCIGAVGGLVVALLTGLIPFVC